ncbi:MAG: polyprenyl synthetase family protein [Bacteroidota bacterium]
MHASQFERRYQTLRWLVDKRVARLAGKWESSDIEKGCRYVLRARGKRVRAILLLLSCEAVGGHARNAVDAGAAVEAMHNFTLVHDDIMDNADARRGRPTVHRKWDANTALLVGDVLLGLAYKSVGKTDSNNLRKIISLFTEGLLEVCEGQALDLEFERRGSVSLDEYFVMIEKKTARLISMSTELGGLLGNGTAQQVKQLYKFGRHLGRAFQLQDDLLDVAADEKKFGKTIGGDIIEGKKTFLLLTAWKRAVGGDKRFLGSIMQPKQASLLSSIAKQKRIATVTALYEKYGVMGEARKQIARETDAAVRALAKLPHNRATRMLGWFSDVLLHRTA